MRWVAKMKKDKRLKKAGFPRRSRRPKPRCIWKRRAWEALDDWEPTLD